MDIRIIHIEGLKAGKLVGWVATVSPHFFYIRVFSGSSIDIVNTANQIGDTLYTMETALIMHKSCISTQCRCERSLSIATNLQPFKQKLIHKL